MTAYCNNICTHHKASKPSGIGRYAAGQKRCNFCAIYIEWEGIHCPCCKRQLRCMPRSKKSKEKYQEEMIKVIA